MANRNNEHIPTDEQRKVVKAMAGYGMKQSDICSVIGISENTLRKHYINELGSGGAEANAKVAESLYRQAITGNTTAAIFWAKARMNWSEKNVVAQEEPFKLEISWGQSKE